MEKSSASLALEILTTNFLFGIPHFAISIALQKNGETLSGIVYNPITDDLFWAVKGKGAFCNNKRLRVSVREKFGSCTIGTGIPHKGLKDHEEYLVGLKKIINIRGRNFKAIWKH